MVDFRVADSAPEHGKLRAAGPAAIGIWCMAGAYAMRELTDGWVPDYWVQTWPAGKRHAATLVKVGLWRREQRNGIDGYAFHDWDQYQRPAQKVVEQREKARGRMAAFRAGAHTAKQGRSRERSPDVRANTQRTFDRTDDARSPSVRDSFGDSLSRSGGDLGGESSGKQRAGTRNGAPPKPPSSENRPPERCTEHRELDTEPGPCRGCMKAREHAEQWDRDTEKTRITTVRACTWCDADGWRVDPANRHRGPISPGVRCDHTPLSQEPAS